MADFNGDGRDDLVWMDDNNRSFVWHMDGTTIVSAQYIGRVGGGPDAVRATGDVNGDGYDDIVWRNFVWFMGPSGLSGERQVNRPAPRLEVVAAPDTDGDGRSEIWWEGDSVDRSYRTRFDGISFQSAQLASYAPDDYRIRAQADFDSDGREDLLFQNGDGRVEIWSVDDQSQVSATSVGQFGDAARNGWLIRGAGDLDGDGSVDIVWQDRMGNARVWFMDGASIDQEVYLGRISINEPKAWSIRQVADLDGDGSSELVWQHAFGATAAWTINGRAVESSVGIGSNLTDGWRIATQNVTATRDDLDGDGRADIVWRSSGSSGQSVVWYMNGTDIISNSLQERMPQQTSRLSVLADFDGDGDADIVWHNSTNGLTEIRLTSGTTYYSYYQYGQVAVPFALVESGDLDGDGRDSLIYVDGETNVQAVSMTPGAPIPAPVLIGRFSTDAAQGWRIADVADFTGDGNDDILWENDSGLANLWVMDGTTAAPTVVIGSVTDSNSQDWWIAGAGDLDGDGWNDIVWQNVATGQAVGIDMEGTSVLGAYDIGGPYGANWRIAQIADLDGDGDDDIVWDNPVAQRMAIWTIDDFDIASSIELPTRPGFFDGVLIV